MTAGDAGTANLRAVLVACAPGDSSADSDAVGRKLHNGHDWERIWRSESGVKSGSNALPTTALIPASQQPSCCGMCKGNACLLKCVYACVRAGW